MKIATSSSLLCKKHKHPILFICTNQECMLGNFICDKCLSSDPNHKQNHKNFIMPYSDFNSIQNAKPTEKLIPALEHSIGEIEKNILEYSQHCEKEVQDIDMDFAGLFKIFFSISENAKTFLKEHVRGDVRKIQERLYQIKRSFREHNAEKQSNIKKKGENFFSNLFTKENKAKPLIEDTIFKIIKENSVLNNLRSDTINLARDSEVIVQKKIKYKKNESSKQLYDEIKSNLERSCKEMYRMFKQMIEGGDPNDLKRSIFSLKKSQIFGGAQTVTIDLSQNLGLQKSITLKNPYERGEQNNFFLS